MATARIGTFGGIAPRIHPTLLGDTMATEARNCLLKSGKLVPLRQPSGFDGPMSLENGLSDIAAAKTVYLWHHGGTSTLLAWPGIVHVAPSNLARDNLHRIFVSGETGVGGSGKDGDHPAIYVWHEGYDPETGLTNALEVHDMVKAMLPEVEAWRDMPGGLDPDKTVYYTYFVQTWVDRFGYESQPSNIADLSDMATDDEKVVEMNDRDTVRFGAVASAPSGAAARRIYAAIPGSSEQYDGFRFCFEQKAGGAGGFAEVAKPIDLVDAGETLPDLQSAKADLDMVAKVPGNFYAGVERGDPREVRFSEVANFSIWHDSCVCTLDSDVVALGVAMNTVFALTAGAPYAITGTAPDAMVASSIATPVPCLSPRSVATYNGAVFYASHDGYYMLSDSSPTASCVTSQAFSRREWWALGPESCFAVVDGDAIMLWFPSSGANLVLNMKDDFSVAITTHDIAAVCACPGGPGGRPVIVGGAGLAGQGV